MDSVIEILTLLVSLLMGLDITTHKGKKDKPSVILIHGLGVDKNIWINPLDTKIFAKNVPVRVFTATRPKPSTSSKVKKISLGEFPEDMDNLWNALRDGGFNLICWSQKRPVGPISMAVEELEWVVKKTKRLFPGTPIALIGHSRGGLIARKFMERKMSGIKALITISTPHAGSSLSKLGEYIRPFSAMLKNVLPKNTHGKISEVIKNVTNLIEGNALKELLPDSTFIKNLKDIPQQGVSYMSLGGTEPRLLTIYLWKRVGQKLYPRPLLSIPDSLLKIIPPFLLVDEITPGKGDGLVSARSSLLPWASKHYNLPANHISILWNKKTINSIISAIDAI